jgi:pyruvate kinase
MIHTKIIATIGPASESPEMLGRLIDAGVNVFRLNFSHGTLEQHARTFERIQAVRRKLGCHVAVMGDLCGPKIRVDPIVNDSFTLAVGDRIEVVADHVKGTAQRISTNRPELVGEAKAGHRLLIDDGNVRLRVESASPGMLACICEAAGVVSSRKGVNVPDTELVMSALTDKDRIDLAWAMEHRLDYIAMSFVRTAADLRELRDLMPLAHCDSRVVAKVETPQAARHLEEIVESADAVLVARGDMGVEMDLAQVPIIQKRITRMCRRAGKPAIIATQMLQSMINRPTATRAEVSDVANAILDSADAVMLSAETSVGQFPTESVAMMARIAAQTESFAEESGQSGQVEVTESLRPVATAVAHGAALLARELHAKAVAVWTATGNTARLLSKSRLGVPVVGLSPEESVCRRMCMYYGVMPIQLTRREQITAMLRDVDEALLSRGIVQRGDLIVVVAGTHLKAVGSTNALLIHLVGDTSDAMPWITD